MSLVFYDTETTGVKTFFDQILQFGAIRTDANLEELDRFEIRCRLSPHIVPSPEALRVNGVTVSRLTNPKLPSHYEMTRAIRAKLLDWSPSIFLGWNTIRFDEEIFRQALYKTLHNPYVTNTKGNCRSDVMRMAQACSLYAPNAIRFPKDESGRVTFRLEAVAEANGFSSGLTHEALRDVQATIFVARLIMENASRVWSTFMRFSKKSTVVAFISEEPIFCLHSFYSGQMYSCFATLLGQNETNPSEWYAYDLDCDPESIASLPEQEFAARLGVHPKPVRALRSNAAPILFSADDAADVGLSPDVGMNVIEKRRKFIEETPGFKDRLLKLFQTQKIQFDPSPHVEMQIYNGFPGKEDEALMEQFHAMDWKDRSDLLEQFRDERLKSIGTRLIHAENPHVLNESLRQKHDREVARRLLGHDEKELWMTLPTAINELGSILLDSAEEERQFLKDHEQHLQTLHGEMKLRLGGPSGTLAL